MNQASVRSHTKIEGAYWASLHGEREQLATLSLAPGTSVYGETRFRVNGIEYRIWDPYRSKLAGAILKGELPTDVIKSGDKVLYLGASTGTTISHVSDIVGSEGLVVGVELSARVGREFIEHVAKARPNVNNSSATGPCRCTWRRP